MKKIEKIINLAANIITTPGKKTFRGMENGRYKDDGISRRESSKILNDSDDCFSDLKEVQSIFFDYATSKIKNAQARYFFIDTTFLEKPNAKDLEGTTMGYNTKKNFLKKAI